MADGRPLSAGALRRQRRRRLEAARCSKPDGAGCAQDSVTAQVVVALRCLAAALETQHLMLGSPSARTAGAEASEVEPAGQMHSAQGYISPRVSLSEMCCGWWDPLCSAVEPNVVPFFTGDQSILFRQHGFSDCGGGTQQTRFQPSGVPLFTGDQSNLFQQFDFCDGKLKDAEQDSCCALDKLPVPGGRTGTAAKDVPLPSCRDDGCAAEFEEASVSDLESEGLSARGCSSRESVDFICPILFPIASDSEPEGRRARGTPLLEPRVF